MGSAACFSGPQYTISQLCYLSLQNTIMQCFQICQCAMRNAAIADTSATGLHGCHILSYKIRCDKRACFIQCGVLQQRFKGNRRYIPYPLYVQFIAILSWMHPQTFLKIANQHPWPCQPPPPPPPRVKTLSLSLLLPYTIYAETTALLFRDMLTSF